jgi:hypothetical protein
MLSAPYYVSEDIKKMPLGKLSKQQIAKGFDALVELEDAIKAKKVWIVYVQ